MSFPVGWPFGASPELATKYQGPAKTLFKALSRKPDLAGLAFRCAVHECQRASAYDWPEDAARKMSDEVFTTWEASNNAALKFAQHVEKWSGRVAAIRLLGAQERTGVRIVSKERQSAKIALASFLRALATQHGKNVRPREKGFADSYGPFQRPTIDAERNSWPKPAVLLTVSLAHLFHLVSHRTLPRRLGRRNTLELLGRPDILPELAARKRIRLTAPAVRYSGERVRGGACWEAAAEFASVVFPQKSGTDQDLLSTAQRWLSGRKGPLTWIGWRQPRTGKEGPKISTVRSIKKGD
jgi:hypothetical protein